MTINNALMNAILAMDSYNRGYNRAIELATVVNSTQIGNALIIKQSQIDTGTQGVNIGFYALSYSYNGETVISYRGTDGASDAVYGWPLGDGWAAPQGQMAIDFYNEVVNTTNTHLTLTGHSLGGGLAGFVAAISDQPSAVRALIFDSMDYEAAASAIVTDYSDIYIGAYHIEGEVLSGMTPFSPSNPAILVNVDIGNKSELGSVDLHSQATLVLGLYAKTEIGTQTDWKNASLYMWDALYDNDFALSIGMDSLSGTNKDKHDYAATLRTILAYSAIDNGTRVFGDTGIRAMYDDANDLGLALAVMYQNSYNANPFGDPLRDYADEISRVFVGHAGRLAVNKVLQQDHAEVLEGVIDYANEQGNSSLTLRLDNASWAQAEWASGSGQTTSILTMMREALIDPILDDTGMRTQLEARMLDLWGDGTVDQFDSVSFAINTHERVQLRESSSPTQIAMFVGGSDGEKVNGSSGRDLMLGGDGNDTLMGGSGNDVLDGGSESGYTIREQASGGHAFRGDTADYTDVPAGRHAHINISDVAGNVLDRNGNTITVVANTAQIRSSSTGTVVETDILLDFENVRDTAGADVIIGNNEMNIFYHSGGSDIYSGGGNVDRFFISTPQNGEEILVYGGDGNDTVFLDGKAADYYRTYDSNTGFEVYSHKTTHGVLKVLDTESVVIKETNTSVYVVRDGMVIHLDHPYSGILDLRTNNSGWSPGGGSNNLGKPSFYLLPSQPGDDGVYRIQGEYENGVKITIISPELCGTGIANDGVMVGGILDHGQIVNYPESWIYVTNVKPVGGGAVLAGGNPDIFVDGDFDTPSVPSLDGWSAPKNAVPSGSWMIDGVFSNFNTALNTGSPLVLDLDGDGLELVSLQNSAVFWDIDEDGFAENIGWVLPDDGMLGIDLDGDGLILTQAELFGSLSQDGFADLKLLDTNNDNVMNASDAQFSDLLVWRDINQNGISAENELYSLADLNIISMNLNATHPHNLYIEGHEISHASSYTVNDGVNGAQQFNISDVWYQYDNINSLYNQSVALDFKVLALPDIRGFGDLPSLHTAMSLDNDVSDQNSLLSLVTDFANKDFLDVFSDVRVIDEIIFPDIQNILFRWAGVDDVDPASRGEWVDAQKLEFIETLLGQRFLQAGAINGEDPWIGPVQFIDKAYNEALYTISARLNLQVVIKELCNEGASYDAAMDTFNGFTNFNQVALDALVDKSNDATMVSDKMEFWLDVVNTIDRSLGVENLPINAYTALELTLLASDETLSIQTLLDRIDMQIASDMDHDSGQGTSGEDVFQGGAWDDTYNAGGGNDQLFGGIGNDKLRGSAGADTLDGQLGNDHLLGGSGSDTYLYNMGYGNDIFEDDLTESEDNIVFGQGIEFSDLDFLRVTNDTSSDELRITISNAAGGGSIILRGNIGTLVFSDNTTFDLGTMDQTLVGTDGDDAFGVGGGVLYGVKAGTIGSGIDTIYGYAGNDDIRGYSPSNIDEYTNNYLYGGEGNDTVTGANGIDYIYGDEGDDILRGNSGNDELHGGAGNDELFGGGGDDSYFFTSGDDVISESGALASDIDTIYLPDGVMLEDVAFLRYVNIPGVNAGATDLVIRINDHDGIPETILGTITVLNQFSSIAYFRVENLHFYDPAFDVNLNNVWVTTFGSSSNDTILGIDYGANPDDIILGFNPVQDVIDGGAGNDSIYGGLGDDELYGGIGNDGLMGQDGNDELHGGAGNDFLFGDQDETAESVNFVGNDKLYGDAGEDWLLGDAGNDILYGGADNDVLLGGTGNDTLHGDSGNDYLVGGEGDDILYGGSGIDTFYGEDGADIFAWSSDAFGSVDQVYDFAPSQGDKLNVHEILDGFDEGQDDITAFVQITSSGADSLLFVDSNGGGDNFVQIATLYGVTGVNVQALYNSGNLSTEALIAA